jgi:hypothetical protein
VHTPQEEEPGATSRCWAASSWCSCWAVPASGAAVPARTERQVKPWPPDSATPRYHHHYLELDGWEYWTMDEVIADTELINRARLEEQTSA